MKLPFRVKKGEEDEEDEEEDKRRTRRKRNNMKEMKRPWQVRKEKMSAEEGEN